MHHGGYEKKRTVPFKTSLSVTYEPALSSLRHRKRHAVSLRLARSNTQNYSFRPCYIVARQKFHYNNWLRPKVHIRLYCRRIFRVPASGCLAPPVFQCWLRSYQLTLTWITPYQSVPLKGLLFLNVEISFTYNYKTFYLNFRMNLYP